MQRKKLYKLLWSDHPKSLFVGGLVGMLIGLTILLTVIQLYTDLDAISNSDESLLSSDYMVINKQVTALNLSSAFSSSFDPDEVQNINEQDFVKDIGRFVSNQFKVSALMEAGDNTPSFYTELFFEAVDDRFLDVDTNHWGWDESVGFIPIIVPRYYLTLYNFGFAESQKLPKISEGLLSAASFDVFIHTPQGKVKFTAGIAGLSDRLNSILVPMDFMTWANAKYGTGKKTDVNRIILKTEKRGSVDLTTFLEENYYQTEKENKTNSKIASITYFTMLTLGIFGGLIIILAMMVFILSYQLILTKSTPTIKSLMAIGVPRKQPLLIHSIILISNTIMISIVSFFLLLLIKYLYTQELASYGFNIEDGIRFEVVLFAFGFCLLSFLISYLFLKHRISRLFERL